MKVRLYFAALALSLLCGCMGSDPYTRLANRLAEPLPGPETHRVAVVPFRPLTENETIPAALVSDELLARLSRVKKIHLVECCPLDQALGEMRLDLSKPLDAATTKKLGQILGANILILGTVT